MNVIRDSIDPGVWNRLADIFYFSPQQELDAARDDFEAAAGTFQYILDNFDNAPRFAGCLIETACGLLRMN